MWSLRCRYLVCFDDDLVFGWRVLHFYSFWLCFCSLRLLLAKYLALSKYLALAQNTDIGQSEYASDPKLSEDAHFVIRVKLPDEKDQALRAFTYMGVADGVGSWREYGVDPRDFSHKLMQECENILREVCHDHGATALEGRKFRQVISPAEIMKQAYERVKVENIVGSSTACIALFDGLRHQLHFSNLGDSGLIVLRHIDSDVAGALRREKQTPRAERTSDLRLAFVSQQQLRAFNHPFQLGWTGEEIPEGEKSSFKAARDACTSSIHVRRGDIIIMATDGLFDNVDSEEICAICLEWEQQSGFIRGGDIVARERRWSMGNSLTNVSAESVGTLAEALCQRARENSVNSAVDSPFALLAKENDIMWSGGMPDDCTVRKYRLFFLSCVRSLSSLEHIICQVIAVPHFFLRSLPFCYIRSRDSCHWSRRGGYHGPNKSLRLALILPFTYTVDYPVLQSASLDLFPYFGRLLLYGKTSLFYPNRLL